MSARRSAMHTGRVAIWAMSRAPRPLVRAASSAPRASWRVRDLVAPPGAPTRRVNLLSGVNDALHLAMRRWPRMVVCGEDVAFGGVFRATQGLRDAFGPHRVFNTPLCEQEAAVICAEIQFADYIFPAFDQIVNEAAKTRYRSGAQSTAAGLVFRAPYGAVGHGGLYHSQSPEAYFAHCPGLHVVMPRSPSTAKALLLAALETPDPVLFLEPKALYRSAVEDVHEGWTRIPLGKAEIIPLSAHTAVKGPELQSPGSDSLPRADVTLVAWGAHVHVCVSAAAQAYQQLGVVCEVIDLRTVAPWDVDTVCERVASSGRCIVSHEAPRTCGLGAEVAAAVTEHTFLSLHAPVARVCGYDTPFPLAFEKQYLPDALKIFEEIKAVVQY